MVENIQGIVLGRTRYSDKGNILSIFTRNYGHLSFAMKVGTSKRSARRLACMMPLACVNIRLNYRPTSEIQRIDAIELEGVHISLYSDPAKQTICLFAAEFLGKLLRQHPADEQLWQYLRSAVQYLDLAERGIANFHIALLAGLTYFMGVQPDLSGYAPNQVFDLTEGRYRPTPPLHNNYLAPEHAGIPRLLCRLNFANMHRLRLNRTQRNTLLDGMLRYYNLHYPGTGSLKSLEVLRCL